MSVGRPNAAVFPQNKAPGVIDAAISDTAWPTTKYFTYIQGVRLELKLIKFEICDIAVS